MELLDPPVGIAPPAAAQARILPANLLFLISLILVLNLGGAAQMWQMWPGLILTEIFCILLPAWLFARKTTSPAMALRLKWVGAAPCWMGLVIGASLFPLAAATGWVAEKILGYRLLLSDSSWPEGFGGALVCVLALAVSAPFCEEMLFRGYILAAYERSGWRPRGAILAVAALFTAYHLSPARSLGVALFALAFTYIAWRTGSVWPSIAAHMGANGMAALVVITRNRWATEYPSPCEVIFVGIPAAAAAAFCLWCIAGRPRSPTPEIVPCSTRAGQWWPLSVAGVIAVAAAGAEFAINRFPDLSP
jgi:membrane protease YdiL (CAAX protease family)